MRSLIPSDWSSVLSAEFSAPYWSKLEAFVAAERAAHTIYPPETEVFSALSHTAYDQVKVFILGQDPYINEGEAHGLAFSVRPGIKVPPSLRNIYKELQSDLGVEPPSHGHLQAWADQGVLLLNTALSVRAGEANSHKGQGWEKFTDAVIRAVSARSQPAIFVLWGGNAQKKRPLIDTSRHTILQSAHPSPLSAYGGFFGSRPFSQINAALRAWGQPEIDWGLT
jgi:uracil-DNA glycosylase